MQHKVSIGLKFNSLPVTVYVDSKTKDSLLDQYYDLCSGEFDDDFIEINTSDPCKETTVLRASDIMYIQSQELLDE